MDTRTILQHLVDQIQSTPAESDPFFHFCFEKCFLESDYEKIQHHLPSIQSYRELRHKDALLPDGTSSRQQIILNPKAVASLPLAQQATWKAVQEALASETLQLALRKAHAPELKRRFGEKFSEMKMEPRITLIRDLAGYKIGIHSDIKAKVITSQFYLPGNAHHEHIGTRFYRSTAPKQYEFTKQIPFLPNHGYSFTVSDHSYHGVTPLMAEDAPRNSIMLVYYLKNEEA